MPALSGPLELLADRGYDMRPEPAGERILANEVEERMIRNDEGTFAPSTKPFATFITQGIVKTRRWSFSLP